MLIIDIIFNSGRKITLKYIDSCYLDNEDKTWRFFCDMDDSEIVGDYHHFGVEVDGDTVFVFNDTIASISFR